MERITQLLKQYRYGVLILFIGLGLMLLPTESAEEKTKEATFQPQVANVQERLEEILCQIDGAGKVRVMLTEAEGEATHYQMDSDISGDSRRQNTVVITGENREEKGLICQVIPARYQGAIIVCQGGDRASVKLAIVEAVSGVTGLTSDKISVLKMK